MEKIYTLKETADLIKTSTRTVLRYIKSGRLKATKIGQWRIKETAICEFLDSSDNLTSQKHGKNHRK